MSPNWPVVGYVDDRLEKTVAPRAAGSSPEPVHDRHACARSNARCMRPRSTSRAAGGVTRPLHGRDGLAQFVPCAPLPDQPFHFSTGDRVGYGGSKVESMPLPPEIVEWASGLLAQTRALLEQADAGEAVIGPQDVENLRATERDLTALLRADE
jgi:hypothetical protein